MSKFFLELSNSTHEAAFGVPYGDDELVFHVYFYESELQDTRIVTVEGLIHEVDKAERQTLIGPMKGYDGNEFGFEFNVDEKTTISIDIYENDTHRLVYVSD